MFISKHESRERRRDSSRRHMRLLRYCNCLQLRFSYFVVWLFIFIHSQRKKKKTTNNNVKKRSLGKGREGNGDEGEIRARWACNFGETLEC